MSDKYTQEFIEAKQQLSSFLKLMRQDTPRVSFDSLDEADLDCSRFDKSNGEVLSRAVITLRSIGCEWVRKGGGCSMCGHFAGAAIEEKAEEKQLVRQFNSAFDKVEWSDFPILCLYNGGSILNENELPLVARKEIFSRITAQDEIKEVVFETRAEFVNDEIMSELKSSLPDKKIVIAIGLESATDEVRRLLVHKGSSLSKFIEATKIIRKYAELRLYVLVKPPWLTEAEAIDDAVKTIKMAEELGASDIHFEPQTIQKYTLLEQLHKQDLYKLPSLWSIVEILKRISPSKVYINPFGHIPKPILVPTSCEKCNEKLMQAIFHDYNRSFDISIFDGLDCDCKAEWEKELLVKDERNFARRVLEDLRILTLK